jgi:hypothetical protein
MLHLVFWIGFLLPALGIAHPVSFKGSWMIESKFSSPMTEMGIGHTLGYSTALWVKAMSFPIQHTDTLGFIQINHLLKRWNSEDSQGNIYIGAGKGQSINLNSSLPPLRNISLGFFQVDWETRQVYFMIDHQNFSTNTPHTAVTRARGGFAPYLSDFDQQSAWMILEVAQFDHEFLDIRGILRLYYKNILYEIGGSMNGQAIVNLMTHF